MLVLPSCCCKGELCLWGIMFAVPWQSLFTELEQRAGQLANIKTANQEFPGLFSRRSNLKSVFCFIQENAPLSTFFIQKGLNQIDFKRSRRVASGSGEPSWIKWEKKHSPENENQPKLWWSLWKAIWPLSSIISITKRHGANPFQLCPSQRPCGPAIPKKPSHKAHQRSGLSDNAVECYSESSQACSVLLKWKGALWLTSMGGRSWPFKKTRTRSQRTNFWGLL